MLAWPRHTLHKHVLTPCVLLAWCAALCGPSSLQILRPLRVMGYDDAPHGHAEMVFDNVRLPKSAIIAGPGRGFEIAQGRLGPGRIHHCMRLLGMAERSLEWMCARVDNRIAFGKPLSAQGGMQDAIAESRMDIEQARLLTLNAAHLMDTVGNKAARSQISQIKVVAPRVAERVMDRAMQAHGAMGLSQDTPMAHFWVRKQKEKNKKRRCFCNAVVVVVVVVVVVDVVVDPLRVISPCRVMSVSWLVTQAWARVIRLADGPDEVHSKLIGKMELAAQRDARDGAPLPRTHWS